jgi:hypothetical protein
MGGNKLTQRGEMGGRVEMGKVGKKVIIIVVGLVLYSAHVLVLQCVHNGENGL